MRKTLLMLLFLANFSFCFSQISIRGKVLITEKDSIMPLPYANVGIYRETDTIVLAGGTITLEDGSFSINVTPDRYKITVSFLGYKTHVSNIELLKWKEDVFYIDNITLVENNNVLSDILVEASRMRIDVDKKIVTFSDEQVKAAAEARDLMLNLPYLRIDKINNTLSTSNEKDILILINGVRSNDPELKLIPADKVKRVEYYDIPPIRYNASGRVLNVITKDFESGWSGNFYLMAAQFYSMFSPYISYINGRHKYTLGSDIFINPKRKVKDFYEGKYNYSLNDEDYKYIYQNEDQNWGYQHNISFSYSNLKENSYVFQTKTTLGISKDNYDETRIVKYYIGTVSDEKNGLLTNRIKTLSPSLDMFFSRKIKENNELNFNLVGTINNNLQNLYSEEQGLFPFKDKSDIQIRKNTLIGEMNYLTLIGRNHCSLGYKANFSAAKNIVKTLSEPSPREDNISLQEHYLYGETSGTLKKFSYRISLGGKINTSKTSSENDNLISFIPILILGHSINDNNYLRLTYQASTEDPEIQQLSENSIKVMQNVIKKGNPDLKTSVNHDIRLNHSLGGEIFFSELSLFYQNTKNYIFKSFNKELINDEMHLAISSANAAKNYMYGLESDISVKPTKEIKLGSYFNIYKHSFQPSKNAAVVTKLFYPVTLYGSFQYKSFSLDYYQKLGSSFFDGLYISDIEKVSYINAGYSYKNWDFQLSYYFPFVKNTFGSNTLDNIDIQHTYMGWLKSKEKTLGLSVSWKFKTYSKPYSVERNMYNSDDDKGTFKLK